MKNRSLNRIASIFSLVIVLWTITVAVFAGQEPKALKEHAIHGYNLLSAKRFANAETALRQAINHKDFNRITPKYKIQFISLLESSLIYQNKYADVLKLLNQKLAILELNGMKSSFEYATSLLNVAESEFYLGNQKKAIETTQASVKLLSSLPNPNQQVIAFAKSNIAQYEANEKSHNPMYKDLSDFFTRCENTDSGTTLSKVQRQFSGNLEVGRNYMPKGVMKDIFATAIPDGIKKGQIDGLKRTVFIPDEDHTSDWCIVFHESDQVKLTVVSAD